MPEIKCKHCGQPYTAFNGSRSHCSQPACRTKEIDGNVKLLCSYFATILRHQIVAEVEIRCPGNDSFGKQVKARTQGHLGETGDNRKDVSSPDWLSDELEMLSDYFRPILWRALKGNFIIKTLDDGRFDKVALNDTFSDLINPVVLGNNLLLSHKSAKQRSTHRGGEKE